MTLFNVTIVIYGFQGSPDREQTFQVEAPTRWQAQQEIINTYGKGTTISRTVMAGTPFNIKDTLGSRNLTLLVKHKAETISIKLPEKRCGECRFWDWYYCDANHDYEDGSVTKEFGNCTRHFFINPRPHNAEACEQFEADPLKLPEKLEEKKTGRGYYIEWRET